MHQTSTCPKPVKPRLPSFAICVGGVLLLAVLCLALVPLNAQERIVVHRVPPIYPPIARQMGITGVVVVMATVDASGKVTKADTTSGNKLLATSAIEAVKQWKFVTGDGTQTFAVSVNFEKN
jgi:TonB family protein